MRIQGLSDVSGTAPVLHRLCRWRFALLVPHFCAASWSGGENAYQAPERGAACCYRCSFASQRYLFRLMVSAVLVTLVA